MSELADRFIQHADALARDGRSPLYERLMRGAAKDPQVLERVFPEGAGTVGSVPALRLMAALHHLVLTGRAPALARHFPSTGGREGPEGAWDAARATTESRPEEVRRLAARTVQTNEPGRCAALYGGLLRLAERALSFSERRASDIAPLDVSTEEGAASALSYIWPDERERLARVRLAIDIQRERPVVPERAGAADWIAARLSEPAEGVVTVVWESVMRQYMSDEERAALVRHVERAGARAGERNPLAWVALDAEGGHLKDFQLTCRAWPGGNREVWADSGYHGPPVTWH